jgi:serine/threonine protein kinase
MGEVYRARDTTLDRHVALKLLPADVAASPTRLERFQREARMVASLNHPHIVTLFSVEEPRHSPSTTAPWHFRASRRPFLFASLDAAAYGAHERAGEFRREHSAVRPGVANVRR